MHEAQTGGGLRPPQGLHWNGDRLLYLEQTLLPGREEVVATRDWREIVAAIRSLAIRGAPAIGVAGAFAVLLAWREIGELDGWRRAVIEIENARPTAVNLSYAVGEMLASVQGHRSEEYGDRLLQQAESIAREDESKCEQIAQHGLDLLKKGSRVLTHCNTGALVTYGIGTALGIVRRGHEQGLVDHVYACEARPLGQGSRLTMWELDKLGIPATLLADSAAGRLMEEGRVDLVLVGADRIARNGDTANKVGTFHLALLAKHFGIPFYVAAPSTTFDPQTSQGSDIQIEYRDEDELRRCGGRLLTLPDAAVFNPAFDLTPGELVAGFVRESGVINAPYAFEGSA